MSTDEDFSRVDSAAALVATSTDKLPAASRILTACGIKSKRSLGPIASVFRHKPAIAYEWDEGVLEVPFRGGRLIVGLMDVPIPWSQLEGPCATAWWWPEATERMREHKYHLWVVLTRGAIEPIERRLILTKAVAAILRSTDAVGVYWGEGTLVHEPKEFVLQAKSATPADIPGPLWIDVRVEENDDGSFRCFTTGMAPLGFLEIEVTRSTLPRFELMEFVGDTVCYIVNGRLRIAPGETMGPSATEQYKVRHSSSRFDRGTVMQLVMT